MEGFSMGQHLDPQPDHRNLAGREPECLGVVAV
jgi:hypothetical protein